MNNNISVFTWKKTDQEFYVPEYKHDAVFLAIGQEGDGEEHFDTFIVMREDGSVEAHPVALCKIIASVPKLGVIIK